MSDEQSRSLSRRVHGALTRLSPAEAKVARFLASSPQQTLLFASATQIARQAGTSDATVVRAVQSIGYTGMSQMRLEAQEELMRTGTGAEILEARTREAGKTLRESVHQVFADAHERLTATEEMLDEDALARVVALISSTARTVCYGVGVSELAPRYLARKLARLGNRTLFLGNTGFTLADGLLELTQGDLIIVFAPGRPSRDLDVLLDHATAVGAHRVLLTQTLPRKYTDRADVAITTQPAVLGVTSEGLAELVIADVLLLTLAAAHVGQATKTHDILDDLRNRLTSAPTRASRA